MAQQRCNGSRTAMPISLGSGILEAASRLGCFDSPPGSKIISRTVENWRTTTEFTPSPKLSSGTPYPSTEKDVECSLPSSPAPDSRPWTITTPTIRTSSTVSTRSLSSQDSDPYPIDLALSYLQAIDRSPSPTPKRLGDTTYRYAPIDPGGAELRLLRILPQRSLQIECEIFLVRFSELPEYIAISYAWGDLDDTRSIILDGHEFPITTSLWQALHRLQESDASVTVWADALCINQSDSKERNHQVQRMTYIYASAASVAVWLGPDRDNNHLAFELLPKLLEADGDSNSCETVESMITSPELEDHFMALAELHERDYWQRLWVLQELLNGRQVDVYCGSFKTSLSTLMLASRILDTYQHLLRRHFQDKRVRKSILLATGLLDGPSGLNCFRGRNLSLYRALSLTLHYKCQDPRAKVYGVLGLLSPRERSQIRVDYSYSKRKVFANAVEHVLRTDNCLDIICRPVRSCCKFPWDETIPTWLPNFPEWNYHIFALERDFDASRGSKAVASIFSAQRNLRMLAISIGSILMAGLSLEAANSEISTLVTFLEWRALVIQSCGYDKSAHQRFCNLLRHARRVPKSIPPREWMSNLYSSINHWQEIWLPGVPVNEEITALICTQADPTSFSWVFNALKTQMSGLRFCITRYKLDYVLVGGHAHADDEIFVALGCSVSIILRQVGTEYMYIGNAYVEGYMYGRAVEEVESGKKKLENIVLI